jgi:hypothetical protein
MPDVDVLLGVIAMSMPAVAIAAVISPHSGVVVLSRHRAAAAV